MNDIPFNLIRSVYISNLNVLINLRNGLKLKGEAESESKLESLKQEFIQNNIKLL